MNLPKQVWITDVAARDGLQNEKSPVDAASKIELIHRLADAGVRNVEASSFVSPKWVPQMADAAEVMAGISRKAGVSYSVLTPNMKGFEAALAARADEIVIFTAASQTFSQTNTNCSISETIVRFAPVARAAKDAGIRVRAAVSCAWGCPYEGEVSISSVVSVVEQLRDLGTDEMGIADTIGVANAGAVKRVLEAAAKVFPLESISAHFHDTYGQGLANVYAALEVGVARFDSSAGGMGGCPYARGATGNVATEDVLYLMHGLGITTGIDLDQIVDAGAFISERVGKPYSARAGRALLARRVKAAAAA